ncbi:MAG: DNA replication complex GINS family protein [Thaumarchaeota archaeon]|nr:DNA replication complex GINS family protein [Nitrososphaerota archaeon]
MSIMEPVEPQSPLEVSLRDEALKFGNQNIKLSLIKDIPSLKIGSVEVKESKVGEMIEVPRWASDILCNMGFGERENDMGVELFKALTLERIQPPTQLSGLPVNFYFKLQSYIQNFSTSSATKEADFEKVTNSARGIIALRISKLLCLAGLSSPPVDVRSITPEEKILYDNVRGLVSHWKESMVEKRT